MRIIGLFAVLSRGPRIRAGCDLKTAVEEFEGLSNCASSTPDGGSHRVLIGGGLIRVFIGIVDVRVHFNRFLDVNSRVESRVHCC